MRLRTHPNYAINPNKITIWELLGFRFAHKNHINIFPTILWGDLRRYGSKAHFRIYESWVKTACSCSWRVLEIASGFWEINAI